MLEPEHLEFMECEDCRKKPGVATLCAGCLHNRQVIEQLTKKVAVQRLENLVECPSCKYLVSFINTGDTLAFCRSCDMAFTHGGIVVAKGDRSTFKITKKYENDKAYKKYESDSDECPFPELDNVLIEITSKSAQVFSVSVE